MRFGVRDICNVTFRPLAAMDIGSQHFSAYQPCLYIDTATASNMEVATTSVYAQGGRGNARLIAWEGEKTATFSVTDALLSPISFAMLSGAGVIDKSANEKIVHLTVDGKIVATGNVDGSYVEIQAESISGYDPLINNTDLRPYAMVLNDKGGIIDYLGAQELSSAIVEGSSTGSDDNKEITTYKIPAASNVTFKEELNGKNARVDCYAKAKAPVTTLTVDAENFGGTFYIEAETLFRDEATGQDFPATFIIPKGKIQGNFTFSMAATGDPSTFDFTIDCTRGAVRTLGSSTKEQVLYAIDIIDNISTAGAHAEKAKIDVPDTKATWSARKPITTTS